MVALRAKPGVAPLLVSPVCTLCSLIKSPVNVGVSSWLGLFDPSGSNWLQETVKQHLLLFYLHVVVKKELSNSPANIFAGWESEVDGILNRFLIYSGF